MIKFEKTEAKCNTECLTIENLVRNHRGATFYGSCGEDGCYNEGYWYVSWAGADSLSDATVFFGVDSLGRETAVIIRWCDLSMREVE